MSPNEQGRYCGMCQKSVVDFTNMTNTQLANYFKANKGNTCGRFYDDQLNQSIAMPRKEIPWLKYFFTFTLPAFLFSLRASAQKKIENKKTELTPPKIDKPSNSYMNGGYKIYDSASYKEANKNKNIIQGEFWNKPNSFEKLKVDTLEEVKVYSTSVSRRVFMGDVMTNCTKRSKNKVSSKVPTPVPIVNKNLKNYSITPNSFNIHPNPTTTNAIINLSLSEYIIGEIVIEIFSANGNLIKKEFKSFHYKTKSASISTANMIKGFFICRITEVSTNLKLSSEFIVQ